MLDSAWLPRARGQAYGPALGRLPEGYSLDSLKLVWGLNKAMDCVSGWECQYPTMQFALRIHKVLVVKHHIKGLQSFSNLWKRNRDDKVLNVRRIIYCFGKAINDMECPT